MGHLGRFLCQTAPRPRTDTPERPHHITLTLCSPTQIRKHCSWGSGPLSNGGGRPSHCGTSVYHIGTHQHMFSIGRKAGLLIILVTFHLWEKRPTTIRSRQSPSTFTDRPCSNALVDMLILGLFFPIMPRRICSHWQSWHNTFLLTGYPPTHQPTVSVPYSCHLCRLKLG